MLAVQGPIDLVDDGRIEIAAAQKIRMQRVHHPILRRGGRRHQGLAQHLAAEHLRTADVAALAAKQIHLEPLERHHLDQILEQLIHGIFTRRQMPPDCASPSAAPTPRRFCMMGLVVVYCRNWRFSGNR